MLDDCSDTTTGKDDIGAIVDSCRDDSMLNCTDALSLSIGSLCALVLLRPGERPKILEIALNVQEQMLRIRKNAILILAVLNGALTKAEQDCLLP